MKGGRKCDLATLALREQARLSEGQEARGKRQEV
jgi:hypothetical protein